MICAAVDPGGNVALQSYWERCMFSLCLRYSSFLQHASDKKKSGFSCFLRYSCHMIRNRIINRNTHASKASYYGHDPSNEKKTILSQKPGALNAFNGESDTNARFKRETIDGLVFRGSQINLSVCGSYGD